MSKLTAKSGKLSAILLAMSPKEREKYKPRCAPVEKAVRGQERNLKNISEKEARATPGLQYLFHKTPSAK